ncbi:hypothetical protein QTG54_003186 [Skeletonema marinoi]|uniref:Uncharacterized protein n=1 Tax=Skeletonema marinoi TaxID=267567 RepID=A0AAD9DHS4_9STRA|nr:hypothetical protein QTG54_003186 [Skeletonema marinoi]
MSKSALLGREQGVSPRNEETSASRAGLGCSPTAFPRRINSNKHTELATPVELSLIFMLSLFDYFRINVATQGNKKSKVVPMAWATLLGCPIVIGGYIVLLKMQTQTSPFDNYLNTVPLSFIATEFALSVPAMIAFQKKS